MPDEKPPADPNTEETERAAPQKNSAESQFPLPRHCSNSDALRRSGCHSI